MRDQTLGLIFAAFALAAGALPAQAGPYEKLASDLSAAARRTGYIRVAILPFQPANGGREASGMALAERLLSRMVMSDGLQIVERTLLKGVLREAELGTQGVVDPAQAKQVGRVLGVDALVTGTFLRVGRDRLEVHTRLIDSQTARILGASTVEVPEELAGDSMWSGSWWDIQPPDLSRVPMPDFLPDPFRDAVGPVSGCDDWERRVDEMQDSTLGLKARYWAARLRDPSFSRRELKRNPGSEIRTQSMRQDLYARIQTLHRSGEGAALTVREQERLDGADRQAETLVEGCNR